MNFFLHKSYEQLIFNESPVLKGLSFIFINIRRRFFYDYRRIYIFRRLFFKISLLLFALNSKMITHFLIPANHEPINLFYSPLSYLFRDSPAFRQMPIIGTLELWFHFSISLFPLLIQGIASGLVQTSISTFYTI